MKLYVKLAPHGEYYCYTCFQGLYANKQTAIDELKSKYKELPYIKVFVYTHNHNNDVDNDNVTHTHVMAYNTIGGAISQREFEKACDNQEEEYLDGRWEIFTLEETEVI